MVDKQKKNHNRYIFTNDDIGKKVKCTLFKELCEVVKITSSGVYVKCKYGDNILFKKGLFIK